MGLNLISIFFCFCNFSASIFEESKEAILSLSPWTISPDDGHGARKLKSLIFAGGEILTNPFIYGIRINSCIETQEPNEKPATQNIGDLVVYSCTQCKTLAASLNSPSPSS